MTPATAQTSLATFHRPKDFDALQREALKLSAQGLTARDIGQLLGIGAAAAATLLGAKRLVRR